MYFKISEALCIVCIMPCVWSHGPLLCVGLLLPALRSPFILSKAKQDQSSHQSTNFLCFLSQAVMSCRAVNSVIEQIGHSNENLMKIDWVKSWFLMVSSHSSHTATHTASFAPLYLFLTSLKHLPCRRPSFFSLPFSVSFHSPSQVSLCRARGPRELPAPLPRSRRSCCRAGGRRPRRRTWRRHPESERRQKISHKNKGRSSWASEQLKWLVSGMVGIVVFGVAWLAHKLLTTSKGTKVIPWFLVAISLKRSWLLCHRYW